MSSNHISAPLFSIFYLFWIFWASLPLFVQHFIELGCFSSGMEEYLHRSIWSVSEWIFWTGWLRASRCSVRASSPTDVWVSKPAYSSKSAVGVHRPARSCLAPWFTLPPKFSHRRRCTQPAEPVSSTWECLFDGKGWPPLLDSVYY